MHLILAFSLLSFSRKVYILSQYPNPSDPYSTQSNPYSYQPSSSYQYPPQGYPPPSDQPYPQQPNQQYGQQPYYPPPPPYYPPSPPPPKKNNLLLILGIIGGIILLGCIGLSVFVATAGQSTRSSTSVVSTYTASTPAANGYQGSGPTPAPAANSTSHHKIGEVVKVSDTLQMTVNSAKTDSGDNFNKPSKDGDTFILIDVTLKNTSSKEEQFSSLLQFHLHDASGRSYIEKINTNATAPDGKVEPGESLKGTLTYEIPSNMHQYVFSFEPNIVDSGQTEWDVTV